MSVEEYFNLYKKCVDIESIQFSLEDFKRFQKSRNIKIEKEKNCIAILSLTDREVRYTLLALQKVSEEGD